MGTRARVTVAEAAQQWLHDKEAQGYASNSLATTRYYVSGYLTPKIGHLLTHSLEPRHLVGMHAQPAQGRHGARTKPVGTTTQDAYRSKLLSFLTYCDMRGLLTRSPRLLIQAVPRPHGKRKTIRQRLTPRELLAVLDSYRHPRDRMVVALAIFTGYRSSEIQLLRVGSVDLNRGNIRVVVPKTEEVDDFPISAELDVELRRYLTWYAAEAETEGWGSLDDAWYLVPSKWAPQSRPVMVDGHRTFEEVHTGPLRPAEAIKSNQLVQIAKRGLRAIGVDGTGEGMHTFRRSAGRAFFELHRGQGADHALLVTSRFLHHSLVSTTQHYLGFDHETEIRDAALRGKPFLSALIASNENVVDLSARREAEGLT